jgi:glycosyltransferase involved in cell wall biosynthesis
MEFNKPEPRKKFGNLTRIFPSAPSYNLRLYMLAQNLSAIYETPQKFLFKHFFPSSLANLGGIYANFQLSFEKMRHYTDNLYLMAFPQYYSIFKTIKKRGRGILIFDFHDDTILQQKELGIPNTDKTYEKYRNKALLEADLVLVTGKRMISFYHDLGIEMHNPLEVMCAADPTIIRALPYIDTKNVVCAHKVSDMNSYRARAVDVLIQAMNIVVREVEGASLTIVGCQGEEIKRQMSSDADPKLGLELVGLVPNAEIWKYYARASVCALPIRNQHSRFWNSGTGMKFFEYMASGRPLISIKHDEYDELLPKLNCGLIYDGSVDDLARNITRLLTNPKLAEQLGANGRKAVIEEHNWHSRALTVAEAIDKQ